MPVADVRDKIFVVDSFTTINKKLRQDALDAGVGTVAQNVRYDSNLGELSKRLSRAEYGGMTTLGTSKVIHADRYYNASASTRKLIIAYDTTIKIGDDSDGSFSNLFTGLTADIHKQSLTYKDIWYVCDGTNTNGAYDATNAEDMGVPTPTAPTVAEGAATGLTGAYKYKVSYEIDSYQEGSASPTSNVIDVTDKKITVTISVSTNGRATARFLYRTEAGGSTYYFHSKISDNSTTTVTDSTADGSLDTTREASTDYGAPPKFKYMVLHKERIFGFRTDNDNGDSEAVYSDIRSGTSYPDVYPAANSQKIAPDDGDVGTGVVEDNFEQLIFFKQNGIYKYNTDTDDPVGWTISGKLSEHGNIGATIAKSPKGVFFLSRYGNKKRIMVWNGSRADVAFEEMEPTLSAIVDRNLGDVKLHYHNGFLLIAYTDPDVGLFNNRILMIDIINGGNSIDAKNVACFSSWMGEDDRGELYTGTSDATGFVIREDAENFDLEIKLKSELDLGTATQITIGGTESAPTLTLIEADLADDIGEKTWADLTGDAWEDRSADIDTWWPSGAYVSNVIEINALNLHKIFWTETVIANTDVLFQVRTGDTVALCEAADWSDLLLTPTGTDISSISPAKYIQYKCKLLTKDTTDAPSVFLSVSTYMVKITAGLGAIAESAIEMIRESGFMDFGFKRQRKRMRHVKIEFERSETSGTLTYSYYIDGATSVTASVDIAFSTYATQGFFIYNFPLGTYPVTLKHRLRNNDLSTLKIKKLSYLFSVEPLYDKL